MRPAISSERATACGIAREQARHLGGGLQVALGVGLEAVAGVVNRAFLADAGEHVGQRLAIGVVIDDVVGGDERGAHLARERGQLAEPPALVAVVGEHGAEIGAARRGSGERAQALAENRRELPRRDGDEDLAFARGDHLLERELALALDRRAGCRR